MNVENQKLHFDRLDHLQLVYRHGYDMQSIRKQLEVQIDYHLEHVVSTPQGVSQDLQLNQFLSFPLYPKIV